MTPVGCSFVRTLPGSSLYTYNLKLQIRELRDPRDILFLKLGFLDIKERTALKKRLLKIIEKLPGGTAPEDAH